MSINKSMSGKKKLGFFKLVNKIIKYEGVKALWRGNLTNLVRYVPSIGLNFYFRSIFFTLI